MTSDGNGRTDSKTFSDQLITKGSVLTYLKNLESNSAISKLAESLNKSNSTTQYLKALEPNSSLQKLFESLDTNNSIAKHLSVLEKNSAVQRLFKSLNKNNSVAQYLKALEPNSPLQKLFEPLNTNNFIAKHLSGLEKNNSVQRWFESLDKNNSIAQYLKALEQNNSIYKLVNSLTSNSYLTTVLGEIEKLDTLGLWGKSTKNSRAFIKSLENLGTTDYLNSLFEEIEKDVSTNSDDLCPESDTATRVNNFDGILQELASADTASRFSLVLQKAPKLIKWLLYVVILNTLWQLTTGAISGVIGNIVTPYVQTYLERSKTSTQREKIKEIKKMSFPELGISLRNCRFVTAQTLRIRATPNANGPIVGELKFSQVVSVLSTKGQDWIEISYEYGDGSTITGWVFTRYTAKFRN
jgi:hypothetical protein